MTNKIQAPMSQDAQSRGTITERQQAIVEEFTLFPDWISRYEYLIELGDQIPLIEDAFKTDVYKIHGCQSQVWIRAEEKGGCLFYWGDSDAKITKGLAALIIRVLSGQPPEAIAEADFGFLGEIGMAEHLTTQRQNGLHAMVEQMKARALAHGSASA